MGSHVPGGDDDGHCDDGGELNFAIELTLGFACAWWVGYSGKQMRRTEMEEED